MVTRLNQTDGTKLFVKNQSESVELHSTHSQDKCQMSDIFITTLSKLNDFHERRTLITKSFKSKLFQESNGTTWPVPTRSRSYARMWMVTWPTPDNISPRSEFHEKFVIRRNSWNKVANTENYWLTDDAIPCNVFSSCVMGCDDNFNQLFIYLKIFIEI